MTKIKPMTVQEIAEQLKETIANPESFWSQEIILGLALAFIEAEARARKMDHAWFAETEPHHGQTQKSKQNMCEKCNQKWESWIAAVKREVGFPEDQ